MSGNCKSCKNPGCVMRGSDWTPNPAIHCYGYEPMTNADRIRSITDEELAELIGDYIDCCICKKEIFQTTECPGSILIGEKNCYGVWLDWLKQEAKE